MIKRDELVKALKIASKFNVDGPLIVRESALLEFDDNNFEVSTTTLPNAIKVNSGVVENGKMIVIPTKSTIKILGAIKTKEISLSFVENGCALKITGSDGSTYRIVGQSDEEFPSLERCFVPVTDSIDADNFLNAVKKVSKSVYKEQDRNVNYFGVMFSNVNGNLALTATDGFVMNIAEMIDQKYSNGNFSVAPIVINAIKTLKMQNLKIGIGEIFATLSFVVGKLNVVVGAEKLGEFQDNVTDFSRYFEKAGDILIKVPAETLLARLGMAKKLVRHTELNRIKISVDEKTLTITAKDAEVELETSLNGKNVVLGERVSFDISSKILFDVISTLTKKNLVEIKHLEQENFLVVKEVDYSISVGVECSTLVGCLKPE